MIREKVVQQNVSKFRKRSSTVRCTWAILVHLIICSEWIAHISITF